MRLRARSDRAKNNLQVITSLLRLKNRKVLKDMQGRIQSMALLHETLYRSGTFAAVDLGVYLRHLATQSFRALTVRTDSVKLDLRLDSVNVEMDQAIPCGLLVNELISNCMKHAFPDDRARSLGLQLASDLARQLGGRLEIEPGAVSGVSIAVTWATPDPVDKGQNPRAR